MGDMRGEKGLEKGEKGRVSHLMGALFRVCATWATEIVGRLGVAFELIEWAAGKDLRGLNYVVSS